MAEKKIRWTEQQRRAIMQRGSDVLVTASAGTGKTAVLSGRCVNIVSDKSICPNVWSILVLTFTDAAAEQMRLRIAEQLKAEFTKTRDNHLRCQLMLLQGADISTIHSFCKRLITEYFYKLGLDPTFRVIDSDEQELLKSEVLEKTIDWAWQQSNLQQALGQLLRRRDLRTNDGFIRNVIEISNFLDSVISRERWYERAALLAEIANPFSSSLGEKQKQIIADKLQQIVNQLGHAQKLCRTASADSDWADRLEDTHIRPVRKCIELLNAGKWEDCAEKIRSFKKPTTYTPKEPEKNIAELIHDIAKGAVDDFGRLSELAIVNPEYLDRLSSSVSLQTKVLIELVKKFDWLYSQAKKAVNCMDFADLEHNALRLLTKEIADEDALVPSETALLLRERFKYIFVDEYQDINPVQQAILDAVSSGGNIFVVGDIKQSIYAFRGAMPGIFLEHLKPASADPQYAPNGLRVDLNANFRSVKGILDFVNKLFGRIMTVGFADIDYDESAKLSPAAQEDVPGDNKTPVELHILDETDKSRETKYRYTSRQCQAAMIAQRIRQMVGAETGKAEFEIFDKQQERFRFVEYRDIVILMRSPSKRVNDYVEVLRLAGIPVSCEAATGYFETTEITDLVCLLKVLDNPLRDIESAAVLRSPFFNVSDSELAKIKIHGKTGEKSKDFYSCAVEYCTSGPERKLAEKLQRILAQIETWRTIARRGSLADLIWQIYRQTDFLSFVSALPNGQQRRANLLKLHGRAIQFEGFASTTGIPSLTRFVEFIEKLHEAGQDWAAAEPEAETETGVRIISVHKSKGLEFPVVFLAELDGKFNKKDSLGDCLADAANTLGLQIIDDESNSRASSLAYQVIAEQKLATMLAEEMRILYVGTTRARNRLILSASEKGKNCRDIISSGFYFGAEAVPDWQLRSCKSPLEWLLYGLCDQKNLHTAFETGLEAHAHNVDLFSFKQYNQTELEQLAGYIHRLKTNKSGQAGDAAKVSQPKRAESKLLSKIKKSLGRQYHFGQAPFLPAKLSVSQLTHRSDEYIKLDYSKALEIKPKAVSTADSAGVVDSRLIGTATHLVISRLDLGREVTKEAIDETKERLVNKGVMTQAVAEQINADSIIAFFENEIGKAVLDAKNTVWREWPFTFAIGATRLRPEVSGDETVVVQGIIDMLVQTPKGLLVIDLKTDHIIAKQAAERAEFYREQLEIYGRAAGDIVKMRVLGKWLYFLKPETAYSV